MKIEDKCETDKQARIRRRRRSIKFFRFFFLKLDGILFDNKPFVHTVFQPNIHRVYEKKKLHSERKKRKLTNSFSNS